MFSQGDSEAAPFQNRTSDVQQHGAFRPLGILVANDAQGLFNPNAAADHCGELTGQGGKGPVTDAGPEKASQIDVALSRAGS